MGEIIDVRPLANILKEEIKKRAYDLKRRGTKLGIGFIFLKGNKGARIFHKNLKKLAEEFGILSKTVEIEEKMSDKEIEGFITNLNLDDAIHGILPIRPLGDKNRELVFFSMIEPKKDIECLTPYNIGRLFSFSPKFIPSTPLASFEILKFFLNKKGLSIKDYWGKTSVIVGRSLTVGRPLYVLSLMNNLVPLNLHSKVKKIGEFTKLGDIIFSCAGVPHLIKKDMVKKNSIVIDIGINVLKGKIVGDVDTKEVFEKVFAITPVPGGVGEITSLFVFKSLLSTVES